MSSTSRRPGSQGHPIGGDGTYDPSRAEYDHRTGYGHDVDCTLTERGAEFVAEFGVRVAPQRRLRYWVDWSESDTTSPAHWAVVCSTASAS